MAAAFQLLTLPVQSPAARTVALLYLKFGNERFLVYFVQLVKEVANSVAQIEDIFGPVSITTAFGNAAEEVTRVINVDRHHKRAEEIIEHATGLMRSSPDATGENHRTQTTGTRKARIAQYQVVSLSGEPCACWIFCCRTCATGIAIRTTPSFRGKRMPGPKRGEVLFYLVYLFVLA